jgi:predicted DNA-binding transcriptional regulator AlpA
MKAISKDLLIKYLSDKDLAARYSIHRATPWRWVQNGKLPAPVKINCSTRWRLADIEAWEVEQEASS